MQLIKKLTDVILLIYDEVFWMQLIKKLTDVTLLIYDEIRILNDVNFNRCDFINLWRSKYLNAVS